MIAAVTSSWANKASELANWFEVVPHVLKTNDGQLAFQLGNYVAFILEHRSDGFIVRHDDWERSGPTENQFKISHADIEEAVKIASNAVIGNLNAHKETIRLLRVL